MLLLCCYLLLLSRLDSLSTAPDDTLTRRSTAGCDAAADAVETRIICVMIWPAVAQPSLGSEGGTHAF